MKKIIYGQEARSKFIEAAKQLCDPVKITLGPKGKNVVISEPDTMAYSTKDGITVAASIESDDPFVNSGIQIIRQASMKTVDDAGDGTTTAMILANALLNQIDVLLGAHKLDTLVIKESLTRELKHCVDTIRAKSYPIVTDDHFNIEKLQQIATISSNNDIKIGQLFRDAYEIIGPNGSVIWKESNKPESYVDAVNGMSLKYGWVSNNYANIIKEDGEACEFLDPFIFVTDKSITQYKDIQKIVEHCWEVKRPLVIFSAKFEGQALATFNLNRINAKFPGCAVVIPNYQKHYKEILKDIALYTGAVYFSEDDGKNIDNITKDQVAGILGTTQIFNATTADCLLLDGGGDPLEIDKRIAALQYQITPEINSWEKEFLQARISKLKGGIAYIYAGGVTEVERKETLARVEDAVLAVRAAIEEGYLPGGGKMYLELSRLPEIDILEFALKSIITQLAFNSGRNPAGIIFDIVSAGKSFNWGYNARTEVIEDLCEAGVVDSAKVVRVALENAVSIALSFLNTDCLVAYYRSEPVKQKGGWRKWFSGI